MALHYACMDGDLKEVKSLIKRGNNINESRDSRTPLFHAIDRRHPCLVKYLIKHGANTESIGSEHKTALYLAAQCGYTEIVKLLIKKGANINGTDMKNWTPLFISAQKGNLDIVKLLIEHGADINKTNVHGITPIHTAINNKQIDIILFIMKHELEKVNREWKSKFDHEIQCHKETENRLSKAELRIICIICMVNERDTILLPCTHLLFCQTCISQLKQPTCPMCNTHINGSIHCGLGL